MADAHRFDAERFCRRALATGHNDLLGLRYRASGNDWVDLEMPVHPALVHLNGGIADGAMMTLADMAGTLAVMARAGRYLPHATVDLRFDNLAAPSSGITLIGHAQCCAIADEIAFVDGHINADGAGALARFAATYKLLAA